jgi:hypothetical protein
MGLMERKILVRVRFRRQLIPVDDDSHHDDLEPRTMNDAMMWDVVYLRTS